MSVQANYFKLGLFVIGAAVLAVMLLGVIGVGALYLSGAIGGGQDVAQGGGDDAIGVSTEGLGPSTDQGGQSTKVDDSTGGRTPSAPGFENTGLNDSFGDLVRRISPDAYQTETSSGRVDVKITSAKIDRLPDGPQPNRQYLLVTIQLQNRGAEQVRYANWDGQSLLNLPVVLMDDSGRMYRQKLRSNSGDAGGWQDADSHFGSGAHPIHVGDADFDTQVLEASEPVLVDFYADWCPPCRALAPTIDRLAGATAGHAKIVKVDIDKSPQVKRRYGVRSIPRLILFHNGEIVAEKPGRSFGELLAAINRVAPGAGEPIVGDETLEPNTTAEQTLVFEAGQGEADFLRLELPADAIGGQGVLTLEIPWSMIAAGTDDRVVSLGPG
jgi:thioredoxin 1